MSLKQNKGRLNISDNVPTAIVKLSGGNIESTAIMFDIISQADKIDPDNFLGASGYLLSLDEYRIYDQYIAVLHSDICKNSMASTITVLRAVQLGFLNREVLVEAVTKEDKSGAAAIDVDMLYDRVKDELPNFNTIPN